MTRWLIWQIYTLRCWLCEFFIACALAVEPKGYVASYTEAAVKMFKRGQQHKNKDNRA